MRVGWISYAPVKGMRLQPLERTTLTKAGIPGDREFLVVNAAGRMVNGKGAGPMMSIVPEHDRDAGTLSLSFPDGSVARSPIELGPAEDVAFFGLTLEARPLIGPLGEALSDHMGEPVRIFASPPNRPGMDRGHDGAATLLSYASLERLREVAGLDEDIDPRRFRMNFGIEGAGAHQEDEWVEGGRVRVGDALMEVAAHVGRCSITTRDPETGVVDLKTLHHIGAYRGDVESLEPLPFGVYGRVLEEGEVAVGDPVEPVAA
jgi:MOSC domain-containing protein